MPVRWRWRVVILRWGCQHAGVDGASTPALRPPTGHRRADPSGRGPALATCLRHAARRWRTRVRVRTPPSGPVPEDSFPVPARGIVVAQTPRWSLTVQTGELAARPGGRRRSSTRSRSRRPAGGTRESGGSWASLIESWSSGPWPLRHKSGPRRVAQLTESSGESAQGR